MIGNDIWRLTMMCLGYYETLEIWNLIPIVLTTPPQDDDDSK